MLLPHVTLSRSIANLDGDWNPRSETDVRFAARSFSGAPLINRGSIGYLRWIDRLWR
jgi:hypothetical protein